MSQLTINGIEIPVAQDGWTSEPVEVGTRERAADGSSIVTMTRRYYRRSGTALFTEAAEARAFECLLHGDGIGWSFDSDLYADRVGLGYSSSGGISVVGADGGVSPRYGAKMLKMNGASSVAWTHGLAATSWSVAWWWWNGSAWAHMAIRSDTSGSRWVNGVLTSGAAAYITATGSALTISQGVGAGATYIDDVAYLPCIVPAAWFATWAASSSAFPKPPVLTAGGDLYAYGGTSVRGKVTRSAYQNRGALDHLQRVEFSLEEA